MRSLYYPRMPPNNPRLAQRVLLALAMLGMTAPAPVRSVTPANPILFVTQVPVPADFATIGSVFGNHRGDIDSAARGGDLWLRYGDGTLKNLTATAGYGNAGRQGTNAIAVRDPAVHWSGSKALFSMVVGAPTAQYQVSDYFFQIYEVSGLGAADTVSITRIATQPANYNNVSPVYASDDQIIFTSDRPINGAAHLYPQLDEYEEQATVSGLWKLNPASGVLQLLNHAPSGDFTPMVDSFGRVLFTQWDHLQRDQQADTDALNGGTCTYCTFNYASESPGAARLNSNAEVFPEPRSARTDLLAGSNLAGHSFNQFFPWTIHEDGTESEVLGHLGRHELHAYLPASLTDDPNIIEYYGQLTRTNTKSIRNMLQIKEDPLRPGVYIGVDAPEFQTHASGMIISMSVPPGTDADQVIVTHVTHKDTAEPDDTPAPTHSGLYRDPLLMGDGSLIAAHTASTRADANTGTRANPGSRYAYRLTLLKQSGAHWVPDQTLTSGISKSVSWWDPDVLVSYSGPLWELQPVEVRARPRPPAPMTVVQPPEQLMFNAAGVDVTTFQNYLKANNLAVLVSRNVTSRDDFEKQQPFNLRVPVSGGVQTIGAVGKIYDVAHLQLFQGDLIRGLGEPGDERAGRRVLAQSMHDARAVAANPNNPGAPIGSVPVASDGSVAAFVPAARALSWQLTDGAGESVVKERYWVTFQPGEVRMCTNCHGNNDRDQAGNSSPANAPIALRALLADWKARQGAPPPSRHVYMPLTLQ